MSLKHGILGLLTYKPMTGYEMMKVIKESLSFFWYAQTSQIYRELEALEKLGRVSSSRIIQTGKPDKKEYTLTAQGYEELNRWLDEHTALEAVKIRDVMTMRVFFGLEGDESALISEMMAYKTLNQKFVQELESVEQVLDIREKMIQKPGVKTYWMMAMRRGYLLAKANIDWADECLDILQS